MAISVDTERELAQELDTSYQRRLVNAALNTYERVYKGSRVSRRQLTAIVRAATCGSAGVSNVGTALLVELAKRHAAARNLLPDANIDAWHNWIRADVPDPAQRRAAHRALNVFRRLRKKKTVSASDVAPIVHAASSKFVAVWDIGTSCLNALAKKHAGARDAMRAMVSSPDANVRFQLVSSLESELPKTLSKEILRKALADKSQRVRRAAIRVADRLRLKALLPDLQEQLGTERDSATRSDLEWAIAMLRDGYLLKHDKKGRPELIVRTRGGWTSPPITKKDIARGRLDSIIADAKAGRV